MPVAANQPEARTAIHTDLGAIFVSLKQRWLRLFGQRPAGFKWIPAGVVECGAWRFCRGGGRSYGKRRG